MQQQRTGQRVAVPRASFPAASGAGQDPVRQSLTSRAKKNGFPDAGTAAIAAAFRAVGVLLVLWRNKSRFYALNDGYFVTRSGVPRRKTFLARGVYCSGVVPRQLIHIRNGLV